MALDKKDKHSKY